MSESVMMKLQQFQTVPLLPVNEESLVAYSGVPGAFAEEAAVQFFGEMTKRLPVANFRKVMEALVEGQADYGVLPIENSSAGNVESNYDLLSEYDVTIVGEQIIEVNQAVMALPGARMENIKTVYSHPQGLMQCSHFLEQTLWHQVSMVNTAVSARKVRDDQDITQAAIASARAARLYGLSILNPIGNNNKNNATRFIILHKEKMFESCANKIGITFGLPHKSGSLYRILGSFDKHALNMTMIESRPIPGKQWEYYFYLEFIGNLKEEPVQEALSEIAKSSIELRILGNYHTKL